MIPAASVYFLTLPALVGAAVAFLVCLMVVASQGWHGHYTSDSPVGGVQKFHTIPTPRIGGVGVYAGLWCAWGVADGRGTELLLAMLIASMPAFIVGLLEDITKRIGVRERLLATMLSGVAAWYLTGYRISSLEFETLDFLLSWGIVSVLFTAFAVGGVANAINIIDGMNGLAGGTVIVALLALGGIAFDAGDRVLAETAWAIAGGTLGFLLLNFPFGKIFLGDGCAYCLGFLLAWISVLLPARNPQVSAWAPLVVCAYPVLEVLYSIYRRRQKAAHPGMPDTLHLHSLIKLRWIRRFLGHWPQPLRSSTVALMCWMFSIMNGWVAFHWANSKDVLIVTFIGFAILYHATYRLVSSGGIEVPKHV